MTVKIDISDVKKMFSQLGDIPEETMEEAYPILKKNTPIRSGNARRRTRLDKTSINSDYAYAGRLDNGWSKQAPRGFTAPTMDRIPSIVNRLVRKIDG